MWRSLLAVLACASLCASIPSRYLPEHARGGIAAALQPELLPASPGASEKHFITVPLDHFNAANKGTMKVKYYTDPSCFDAASGPIFVEMGGEGAAGGARCGEYHRAHKALAVSVEHRFYGESQPDGGRTAKNLKYLSVEQNLADTAAVVEAVQATLSPRRAVMNFGGSYSGATAAWFRGAYPKTTMAAVSSSGVVNAILNFTGFDEQIATAVDLPAPGCAARVRALTAAFVRAFKAGGATWDGAKKAMLAGNLVGTRMGDADFWYALADGSAMADQYGHKASLCDALQAAEKPGTSDGALIAKYSSWVQQYWGKDFMAGCFYDSECFKQESWEASGMSRSWRWQKCSELGYLQPGFTGSLRYEGLSLQDLLDQCTYVFGDALPWANMTGADVQYTRTFNKKFGGDRPHGTKIFFSDFSDDPWQRASVTAPLPASQESPYCLETCNGCGHCGAGVPANVTHCSDLEAAFVAQQLEPASVESWLAMAEE
eukprot:g912.t1